MPCEIEFDLWCAKKFIDLHIAQLDAILVQHQRSSFKNVQLCMLNKDENLY